MVDKKRMFRARRALGGRNKQTNLGEVIRREKEQCNRLKMEFSWPDVCKRIPKCVLFHANELRQIASKGLGTCSYKIVNEFLMFSFEQLINENALTVEKCSELQEKAGNLTFPDAQAMFKAIVTIRRKFTETANESTNNNKMTGDETARLLGLKFDYKPRVSDSEETKPASSTSATVDSSPKYKSEAMQEAGASTGPKFVNEQYEKMLDEYYKSHSPVISRQKFKNTIIDALRSANTESDLADFLGFQAMQLVEYIIEHREFIVASAGRTTSNLEQQMWTTVTKMGRKSSKTSIKQQARKDVKIMSLN